MRKSIVDFLNLAVEVYPQTYERMKNRLIDKLNTQFVHIEGPYLNIFIEPNAMRFKEPVSIYPVCKVCEGFVVDESVFKYMFIAACCNTGRWLWVYRGTEDGVACCGPWKLFIGREECLVEANEEIDYQGASIILTAVEKACELV